MPLLDLRDVEAGYGSIQILHGVSLHVNAGEVVSVIGPNGAGKSTTFKVIMGFIDHLGGEIAFALGDSVSLAWAGNADAGFPAKLDKLLQNEPDVTKRREILGYNPS